MYGCIRCRKVLSCKRLTLVSVKKLVILLFSFGLLTSFCKKAPKSPAVCNFSNTTDNYFKIINNDDSPARPFNIFCKKVDVFGVMIYATDKVSDADLLHASNVMAQYLDNDEDELVDNSLVVDKMIENKASMVLFEKENSKNLRQFFRSAGDIEDEYILQDLYGEEIHPSWNYNAPFDATFEEVLHLITHAGYAKVYPTIFGEQQGSELANAMDLARGGQYNSVPSSYPESAWYSYDDKTCEYDCQVTEYIYWALTSLLGAQDYKGRYDEIGHEWKANTPSLVQSTDPTVYAILTDSSYQLPTVLPDGSYRR